MRGFNPRVIAGSGTFGMLVLGAAFPATIQAQSYDTGAPIAAEMVMERPPGERADNVATLPAGWAPVTLQLPLLVAGEVPVSFGVDEQTDLAFTDAAFFDIHLAYSFGDIEVMGGTSLLPKRPSFGDAIAWQGASVGARARLADWLAASVSQSLDMLLYNLGFDTVSAVGLEATKDVHDTVSISLSLGGSATGVHFDRPHHEASWLLEAGGGFEIAFRSRKYFAAWVGADLSIPVYDEGNIYLTREDPGSPLSPKPRLDFHLGLDASYVVGWDFFVKYSITDRGDADEPGSLLPRLRGGFDQQTWTIGVSHTFGRSDEPYYDDY